VYLYSCSWKQIQFAKLVWKHSNEVACIFIRQFWMFRAVFLSCLYIELLQFLDSWRFVIFLFFKLYFFGWLWTVLHCLSANRWSEAV